MKKYYFFILVFFGVLYVYVAINEWQKEKLIRSRLPKFRKMAKYNFELVLDKARETRTQRTLPSRIPPVPRTARMATKQKENIKEEPSTEAQPIEEIYYEEDDNLHEQEIKGRYEPESESESEPNLETDQVYEEEY